MTSRKKCEIWRINGVVRDPSENRNSQFTADSWCMNNGWVILVIISVLMSDGSSSVWGQKLSNVDPTIIHSVSLPSQSVHCVRKCKHVIAITHSKRRKINLQIHFLNYWQRGKNLWTWAANLQATNKRFWCMKSDEPWKEKIKRQSVDEVLVQHDGAETAAIVSLKTLQEAWRPFQTSRKLHISSIFIKVFLFESSKYYILLHGAWNSLTELWICFLHSRNGLHLDLSYSTL